MIFFNNILLLECDSSLSWFGMAMRVKFEQKICRTQTPNYYEHNQLYKNINVENVKNVF